MASRHTLVPPTAGDHEKRQGYLLIEWVRETIRNHFKAHAEFPTEIKLPADKFRMFETWYPPWVRDFNAQNPRSPFTPLKNERNHGILFGMTTILPQAPA